MFIIIYQATVGSVLFVYIAEIVTSDATMGLVVFTLMFLLTIQSCTTTLLINSPLGIDGISYALGAL